MAHFEIKDLNFAYPSADGKRSLINIDLTIERGQYVTVCGKSGSGKTTLLKHLKSVLTPHGQRTGKVYFDGRYLEDIDLREQSSRIGYVMQNPDNQISKQQAQQVLRAIQAKEKETQDKVNKEKAALLQSQQKEKNW